MSAEDVITLSRDQRDDRIDDLQHTVHQMQHDLESKFARLEALVLVNRPPLLPPPTGQTPIGNNVHPPFGESPSSSHGSLPKPKLDAPKTDGSDPLRWLYKVQEYFSFYETSHAERLRRVTLMLEGTAADWYRWRRKAKLRQTGSVMEYQAEFECILQHVSGAPEANLVSLFHLGLKPHLLHKIVLLTPESLADSFALARELEAKHMALVQSVSPRQGSSVSGGLSKPSPATPFVWPLSSVPLTDAKPSFATPIRRLTRAEKLEKDAKGLCYNCDQRWTKGHRCGRVLFLIGDDDDAPDSVDEEEGAEPCEPCVIADISSLQSLTGTLTLRSLRLAGMIHTTTLEVLIDGGSTHNFIHPRLVAKVPLPITHVPPFRVYVGNGDYLVCDT
ncbi:unnamed protein product [Cuscuta campestris]|uniref:Retrotransposon gag domain-containing protein n=1 Tax=Cuscuta campestris TaxID=132261 RepID=A0A484MFA2_9ASTE|nr:unnamed protein product [Cuscuta campestris]